MITKRNCTTLELLCYLTGWAILLGCTRGFGSSDIMSILALLGLLFLPGMLIFGAVGFVLGGRQMFRPAALCGTSCWMFVNVMAAMLAV